MIGSMFRAAHILPYKLQIYMYMNGVGSLNVSDARAKTSLY